MKPRVPPRPIPTKRRLLNAFWIREASGLDSPAYLYALLVIAILALLGLVWILAELTQ